MDALDFRGLGRPVQEELRRHPPSVEEAVRTKPATCRAIVAAAAAA